MEWISLDPKYTTGEISGKCVKCMAEHELGKCVGEMLRAEAEDGELRQRFDLLLTFLNSTELHELVQETEWLLSEGKKVTLKVKPNAKNGKLIYKIDND